MTLTGCGHDDTQYPLPEHEENLAWFIIQKPRYIVPHHGRKHYAVLQSTHTCALKICNARIRECRFWSSTISRYGCLPFISKTNLINIIAFHVSITDQQTRTVKYKYVNILCAVTRVSIFYNEVCVCVCVLIGVSLIKRGLDVLPIFSRLRHLFRAWQVQHISLGPTGAEIQSQDYKYYSWPVKLFVSPSIRGVTGMLYNRLQHNSWKLSSNHPNMFFAILHILHI